MKATIEELLTNGTFYNELIKHLAANIVDYQEDHSNELINYLRKELLEHFKSNDKEVSTMIVK